MRIKLATLTVLALAAISAFGQMDSHAKNAIKHINTAVGEMNHALPIYDGKRAEADNLARLARKEIIEAAGHGKDNDKFKRLQDGKGTGRYTEEQIEQSQKRMVEARHQLEVALKDLQDSSGKFDETSEAVKDLRKSIKLITEGVNSFNGH